MDLRLRLTIAGAVVLFPLAPLTLRLAHLQVALHRSLEEKASRAYARTAREQLPRGSILDRAGQPLARSVLSWSAFVDLSMVKDRRRLARDLSAPLKLPEDELLRKMGEARRFPWLKTDMTYGESESLKKSLADAKLGCIGIVQAQRRVYPNGDLARSILGSVSLAGAGASGLELSFDRELLGESAKREVTRDGMGNSIYRRSSSDGQTPRDLRLTLDRTVQFYAEEYLADAASRFGLKQGIVSVQDPGTGEILALATYPPNPLKNIAVQDTLEPGSTIKMVAAAAAIEEGILGENETIFCENGKFELAPGVRIQDHEPSGDLTLAQILERSSNIGIVKLTQRLGPARFYRYCRAFGFSTKTGLPLPGETAGTLPVSDRGNLRYCSASFGYGLGVSAIQMLSAYSAVANGGNLLEPKLLAGGEPPVIVRRVASPGAVAKLRGMLEGVVSRGTGMSAAIPGFTVAGKTGTARKLDPDGKYSTTRYTASFIGFVPARTPRFTILVMLDEPKGENFYGSQVAAPVFARLGRRLLALRGVPPDIGPAPLAAPGVAGAAVPPPSSTGGGPLPSVKVHSWPTAKKP